MTLGRRAIAALTLGIFSVAAYSQSLSLTFDDGLDPTIQPDARLWNDQIIAGLRDSKVTSMVYVVEADIALRLCTCASLD
jgi:peptidoglycan-N-acetylglucosamine deacetylase